MPLVFESGMVPQSMMDVCIVDILAEASEESPLTQGEINSRLAGRYGIDIDRKTLRTHLNDLVGCIDRIRYTERTRVTDGEEQAVMTDFWLESEFEEAELRALIYTVIFAKHIPTRVKKDLVAKLESLSSADFRREMGCYVLEDENTAGDYNGLFYNIEELSRAIEEGKRVKFQYTSYSADKKLQPSQETYTASPLGIGAHDGDFYLLATVNGVQNDDPRAMERHLRAVAEAMEAGEVRVDSFRMDRIYGIGVLEEEAERPDPNGLRIRGAGWASFDVQEHLRENPTLSSGRSVKAQFRLTEGPRCSVSDVVDHFGKANVSVRAEGEEGAFVVSTRVNDEALRDFALRHAPCIEVLKPTSLREELAEIFATAASRTHGCSEQEP